MQGEDCSPPAIGALGLKPCTQKLDAQRVSVMVHALTAAVGRVLLWALAPPLLEAVLMNPLGGAATGARLHERAVVFISEAQPARLLLNCHLACEPCWGGTVSRPAKDLVAKSVGKRNYRSGAITRDLISRGQECPGAADNIFLFERVSGLPAGRKPPSFPDTQ
eukprot:scaffold17644_cov54-Phaeocystis_antarctica.AAC.1